MRKQRADAAWKKMWELFGSDPLATRIVNSLAMSGIRTVEDFLDTPPGDYKDMRYIGVQARVRMREVRGRLLKQKSEPVTPVDELVMADYARYEQLVEGFAQTLAIWGGVYGFNTEARLRAELGRIFALGKIIGRRTSYGKGNHVEDPARDGVIAGWQKAVDGRETV